MMTKVLRDSLKELSIALIILGLTRQLIYYGNFKLPIKYFLGLSELWLIISDDLLLLTPFIFLLIYANQKLQSIKNEEHQKTELSKLFRNDKIVLICTLFVFVSILVGFAFSKNFLERLNLGLSLLMLFLFIFVPYLIPFLNISSKKIFPLFCTILFLILLFYKGGIDISNTIHGKYIGTKIVTEKNLYISSDTSYFIGKTDKYIFYHNKNRNSNTIIPTELVTEMELKTSYGK